MLSLLSMLPVLFTLGPLTFYTLGFFLGVGFFISTFITWRRLRDLGFREEKIIDGIIFSTIVGLIFSRIFYIFQNFKNFGFFPVRWIFFGRYPGFSFWGGFLGVIFGWLWFCRRQKWDFWRVADEIAFAVLPFFFLANLGAFFDGTGAGKPTEMPWGVFFPGSLVRQQPVSFFMAVFLLLIWIFILKIERHWRMWSWYKSQAPGFIILVSLGLTFFANFLLAFLKDSRLYFFWLEFVFSLLGVGVSAIILWKKRK